MTMHRQISHFKLLDAVSASQPAGAQVVSCFDPLTRFLTIAYRLDSTAATLAGTLTLSGGADPETASHSPLVTATAYNAVAGAALSNGVVTFSTVAIGSAYGLLRIADPPPYVSAAYVYTSGGGTNRFRARAIY